MILKEITTDHYVVVDDSPIKEEDWYVNNNVIFRSDDSFDEGNNPNQNSNNKKITHSTQPLEWFGGEIIFLSEVKELLGKVDVEKKANDCIAKVKHNGSFIRGYNQALEDNKDKKYTEEDLRNAYRHGTTVNHGTKEHFNSFIQSLQPKTQWEVTFDEQGKLKLV